jgi:hypothetical protein
MPQTGGRTSRAQALEHGCPKCGALAGDPCVVPAGWTRPALHQERHIEATKHGATSAKTANDPQVELRSGRPSGHDPQRVAEATALRASGLMWREVAERMGISRAYAHALVSDPGGRAKAERQRRYDHKRAKQAQERLFDL